MLDGIPDARCTPCRQLESLVFETNFLIDFQRERKNRHPDRAHDFLKNHADQPAYISVTVYGEYAEGFERLSDTAFISVVESFEFLSTTRKPPESRVR